MEDSIFDRAHAAISRGYIEYEFGVPGAYWRGEKYFTLNPTRADKTIKSFSIREDGSWYDFADQSHGDVFDLIAARDGIEPLEAAQRLLGEDIDTKTSHALEANAADRKPKKTRKPKAENTEGPKPDWVPITDAVQPQFEVLPSDLTLYHSLKGEAMFYVVRFDSDSGKEVFPIYFDGARYVKGFPPNIDYRPFFPFSRSGKAVVIVEGEKKRTIAQAKYPQYAFTCWHGGAGAAKKTSVEQLEGCDIILWPDADDVGREAMATIAARVHKIAARVRIVDVPQAVTKGWDIANAIEEGRDVDFLLQTAQEYVPPPTVDQDVWYESKPRAFTDLGNAERFVDRWGSDMRFNVDKNRWVFWDGRLWNDEDQSLISNKIKKTIRDIADLERKGCRMWSKKSESSGRIAAMLSLASNEPGIPVHEYGFDPDPFLFCCQNGIVDLRTGSLSGFKKEALCSKIGGTEYGEAPHPVFDRFMNDITLGRKDYVDFLQRWFGYSLTADVSAQSFAIFYGNGANGKSTLVELMTKIAGRYAKTAAPDAFIQKIAGGGIPNDIAALRGARLVLTAETEANARLAESKIKQLTGGDTVTARFLRAEFFEFAPSWKIVISTNHRPKIAGADYGIWRRIILVPFEFIAQGENLDPTMPTRLWAERVGIFNWMVEGAVKWYRDGLGRKGLGISDQLIQETQEYRQDEDIVGRFISEACITEATDTELRRPASKIQSQASELFRYFITWAADSGEKYAAQMTQTAFGRAMRERGYESTREGGGTRKYMGIQPRRS